MGKLQNNGSMVSGYVTGQALEARLREYLPRNEYGGGGGLPPVNYYTKAEVDALFAAMHADDVTDADFHW